MNDFEQKLFALLFVHGDPLSMSEIAELMDTNVERVETALPVLQTMLDSLPIMIMKDKTSLSLVTRPDWGEFLKDIKVKIASAPLSRAALETLTIILYNDGASKAFIDSVRGINSTLSIRNLVMRGLVEKRVIDSETVYVSTVETLRHLGISNVRELPNFDHYQTTKQGWDTAHHSS